MFAVNMNLVNYNCVYNVDYFVYKHTSNNTEHSHRIYIYYAFIM